MRPLLTLLLWMISGWECAQRRSTPQLPISNPEIIFEPNLAFAVEWKDVRIPYDADQRSGMMPITIPF